MSVPTTELVRAALAVLLENSQAGESHRTVVVESQSFSYVRTVLERALSQLEAETETCDA